MDALSSLRLQLEWGADEALEELPVVRSRVAASGNAPAGAPSSPAPRESAHSSPRPAPRPPPVAAAARTAHRSAGADTDPAASAAAAADLDTLRTAIAGFAGCPLRDTATRTVLPAGNAAGGVLLLGEVPDADEDRSGIAFSGKPGELLDRMLRSIGLERDGVLLAPLIPWRPPGGRPPSARELALCRPFLDRLLVLAAPRFVLLLGSRPARTVLNTLPRPGAGWQKLPAETGLSDPSRALAMRHPATLLGHPPGRKEAWNDLLRLRIALDTLTGT
ncbi:MAG: uracil-DNA glycosylase [Gluconacetobacter diazotrophicus]|nr:uracil-DNA glycosylase [Gluconacetobacter diazotrophicus]